MRRMRHLALAAAAMSLLAVATAEAHNKTFTSQVHLDEGEGPVIYSTSDASASESSDVRYTAYGRVEGIQRCMVKRPVVLVHTDSDGERRVLDRGRTSEAGYFGLSGLVSEWDPEDVVRVRALRKRFGPFNKKHRHICAAASSDLVQAATPPIPR